MRKVFAFLTIFILAYFITSDQTEIKEFNRSKKKLSSPNQTNPLLSSSAKKESIGKVEISNKRSTAVSKQKIMEDYLHFQKNRVPQELKEYVNLRRKVFKSEEEQELWYQTLKDPNLYKSSLERLYLEKNNIQKYEIFQRMNTVNYLIDVLNLSLDEGNDEKVVEILNFIRKDVSSENLQMKKAIAGDKMEIFMALYQRDRQMAEGLLESIKGSKSHKLLTYAIKNI